MTEQTHTFPVDSERSTLVDRVKRGAAIGAMGAAGVGLLVAGLRAQDHEAHRVEPVDPVPVEQVDAPPYQDLPNVQMGDGQPDQPQDQSPETDQ